LELNKSGWPDEGKDANKINSMPRYVASRILKEPLNWNATLLKENVSEGNTAPPIIPACGSPTVVVFRRKDLRVISLLAQFLLLKQVS